MVGLRLGTIRRCSRVVDQVIRILVSVCALPGGEGDPSRLSFVGCGSERVIVLVSHRAIISEAHSSCWANVSLGRCRPAPGKSVRRTCDMPNQDDTRLFHRTSLQSSPRVD